MLRMLRAKGYRSYTVFNHADESREMSKQLRKLAQADLPIDVQGLPLRLVNYDRTPIMGDFDAIKRWWDIRQASGAAKAVLYFNSATLQGGAHEPVQEWWKESPISRYRRRLDALARDLDEFYALLDASGRNVVVFLIPDHGQGLRESSFPRRIPAPQYTHVPVGIKLIGQGRPAADFRQTVNKAPVSYLAVGQIIASFLQKPPFGEGAAAKAEAALARLPSVDYFGENEEARYLRIGDDSYVFDKERRWMKLRSKTPRLEDADAARLGL